MAEMQSNSRTRSSSISKAFLNQAPRTEGSACRRPYPNTRCCGRTTQLRQSQCTRILAPAPKESSPPSTPLPASSPTAGQHRSMPHQGPRRSPLPGSIPPVGSLPTGLRSTVPDSSIASPRSVSTRRNHSRRSTTFCNSSPVWVTIDELSGVLPSVRSNKNFVAWYRTGLSAISSPVFGSIFIAFVNAAICESNPIKLFSCH